MERTVLLLKSEQRKKLLERATKEKVSAAEIHRRAIEQYLSISPEEMHALDILTETLSKLYEQSNNALDESINDLDIAIKELKEGNKHGRIRKGS